MRPILVLLAAAAAFAQTWTLQPPVTKESLRGLSVPASGVVWASGTRGTFLRTTDGGQTWLVGQVPGAQDLDFRDIHALDASNVWLLASGPGDRSRIYRSGDGGASWRVTFTNPDPSGFLDAIAFFDARDGIAVGDPVNGRFAVFTTRDGGEHWDRQSTPPALEGEGAFAASGTCLVVQGDNAWFGTGGPSGARVFHSADRGLTWTVSPTPVRNDSASAGIFSLVFWGRQGIAVGGEYRLASDRTRNIALTRDGGATWMEPEAPGPSGFRSAVIALARQWIAVGTNGSDVSIDGGRTWRRFDHGAWNALAAHGEAVWAVGPRGRIGRLSGTVMK